MVNPQERLAQRKRQTLRCLETDHERVWQAGTASGGDRVQVEGRHFRDVQGVASDGQKISEMFARGQFGHHAAILFMKAGLRGNDVREDLAVADNGGAGFVTGGLDGEQGHQF